MVSESELDLIRAALPALQLATAYDTVHNDECVYSFATPFSAGGLYVSLSSFLGFGEGFVVREQERRGDQLYVHIKSTRLPKDEQPQNESAEQKDAALTAPTRLAIGVEGGFTVEEEKSEVVSEKSLVLLSTAPPGAISVNECIRVRVPLPCVELPERVKEAAQAVIEHSGGLHADKAAAVAWEAEQVKPSKYALELVQLPPHKKINPDPSTWVCEESGARENLWLNLSDGHIGSGRRQWDGSGGTNGALNHYLEAKLHFPPSGFPLVVKLGTITPHGADVYSYAEDEDTEVSDPNLAEHLEHWGINMMRMEKTVASVVEMNIQANEKLELDTITEEGKCLAPLSGPGHVGLSNLGNSCYMNAVLQTLFAIPEWRLLATASASLFESAGAQPARDLLCQLSKLANGLLLAEGGVQSPGGGGQSTGVGGQSSDGESEHALSPAMFKRLVGQGHAEFSSARQQDAQEFLVHLLTLLERAERTGSARLSNAAAGGSTGESTGESPRPLSSLFNFSLEERIEADGQVLYRTAPGQCQLSLSIPMLEDASGAAREPMSTDAPADAASAAAAAAEAAATTPSVPLLECIAKWAAPEPLDDFRGRLASKTMRFKSFPKYLCVHMRRYYVAPDWTARKLRVKVPVPETLNLESMRGAGLQPNETPLPEEAPPPASAAPAAVVPSETIVAQLISMGFSENGCRRAAVAVNNASADAAMEWVFAHMEDADFNEPLPPPGTSVTSPAAAAPDAEAVAMLSAMGFSAEQAKGALAVTGANVERAADWLFSHADDLDAAGAIVGGGGAISEERTDDDGVGTYELFGFVSHMGANTSCGHYVAHLKKDGRWVLFNDRKVAASKEPPLDQGYMYFYERKTYGGLAA